MRKFLYDQVEGAQKQWLSTNQELSYELDKALYVNQLLCSEINRLKSLLNDQSVLGNGASNSNGSSINGHSGVNALSETNTATATNSEVSSGVISTSLT